ncbi:ferritin-like domain-containing protein [Viridibacterium curvum]|uniref:Ferritin-like domain-containing protein n=1 Tax=Viridibacterium curvum TaxID=1101404 RepID=A0ABP9Q7Q8_9RHOO
MKAELEQAALQALLQTDPAEKCRLTCQLETDWHAAGLTRTGKLPLTGLPIAGRPEKPELVAPDAVPRRSVHTPHGHAALIHAVAHIEFNAINLALDCVLRFSARGDAFVTQWLSVAAEEAHHFGLLSERLSGLGHAYGDFPAHNGLWEMAVKTHDDFLARMALVPRLLEARGLDATPLIQARLREIRDELTLDILDIILRDEIGHVAIGDQWFRAECAARGLQAEDEYARLVEVFDAPVPRPPLNVAARLQAGFSPGELARFEAHHSRLAQRKTAR